MFHNNFHYCSKHTCWTPPGCLCPGCRISTDDRQEAALHPCWKDVIPLHKTFEFLQMEHTYCRDEEHEFHTYIGTDLTHKEELRTLVLEKRKEFLELFLRVLEDERTGE